MGTVFNIQRFSVNDGPGIRTTVFLKGCNLHCRWCHNPESISPRQQLMFKREKCILCRRCEQVCPRGVHSFLEDHSIEREKCILCGKCVEVCPENTLSIIGTDMSAEQVIEIVLKDKTYYENSNGGVTISGGEPLLQSVFVKKILSLAKENNISTAVDTAGNVSYSVFEEIMEYTDLFLFDIKTVDPELHVKYTGASNKRILQNLYQLLEDSCKIHVRIPLIRGVNDSLENAREIKKLLGQYSNLEEIRLLPYHDLGLSKGKGLGITQSQFLAPDKEQMQKIKEILGDKAVIG